MELPLGGSIYLFTLQFQNLLLAKMEDEERGGETDNAAYADVDEVHNSQLFLAVCLFLRNFAAEKNQP